MMTGGGDGSDRSVPRKGKPRKPGFQTAKAFTPAAPVWIPELDGFFTHYGIRVSCAGEHGGMVALGHHGNARAVVAAFNRHAEVDVGVDNFEGGWVPLVFDQDNLVATWAVQVDGGDEGVAWSLRWPVTAQTSGAFPVTVPRGAESA